VDIGDGELGPLSSGKLSAGRTFTASDANADVALVDASYATQNGGLTMVVVTHDSTVARRAQRIGVMKNGRLSFKQSARARE
jgi:predicted ABC-type transport system involved in lysophospholipase L1 biosynthesis ATPase subunit